MVITAKASHFIAYGEELKRSKHRDNFGDGANAVVLPEAAPIVFATASRLLTSNNRFSINSLWRRRAVDDGSEGGREEISPSFRLQRKLAEAVLLRRYACCECH